EELYRFSGAVVLQIDMHPGPFIQSLVCHLRRQYGQLPSGLQELDHETERRGIFLLAKHPRIDKFFCRSSSRLRCSRKNRKLLTHEKSSKLDGREPCHLFVRFVLYAAWSRNCKASLKANSYVWSVFFAPRGCFSVDRP